MTDHELAIWALLVAAISAAASLINLLVYIVREAIVPWFHRRKLLHHAFEQPQWVITSKDRYDLKYAPQDNEEHTIIDLILPSHTSDLLIHIILKARASFFRTHAEIGFDGDRHKKPLIQYWFHPFVVRGKRERHPEINHQYYDPDHYSDYHGNYHILTQLYVPKKEILTYAFKIDTRDKGTYKLTMELTVDGILSKPWLTLRVEDPPFGKTVRCVRGVTEEHPHKECFVQLHYAAAAEGPQVAHAEAIRETG
jgi:hypothetical protein